MRKKEGGPWWLNWMGGGKESHLYSGGKEAEGFVVGRNSAMGETGKKTKTEEEENRIETGRGAIKKKRMYNHGVIGKSTAITSNAKKKR